MRRNIATFEMPSLANKGFDMTEFSPSDPAATVVVSDSYSKALAPTIRHQTRVRRHCRPETLTRTLKTTVQAFIPSLQKPWRHKWPLEKLAYSFWVAEMARAAAFTLKLSPNIQKTLRLRQDPARMMSHYINRELKHVFGEPLPYAFIFDLSPSDQLHLHGVIIPRQFELEHINEIDTALARAGGRLKGPPIVQIGQCYLDHLHDGLGWLGYSQKAFDEACTALQTHKVTFISNGLRRLCRDGGQINLCKDGFVADRYQ
jgi:hypothetical protein